MECEGFWWLGFASEPWPWQLPSLHLQSLLFFGMTIKNPTIQSHQTKCTNGSSSGQNAEILSFRFAQMNQESEMPKRTRKNQSIHNSSYRARNLRTVLFSQTNMRFQGFLAHEQLGLEPSFPIELNQPNPLQIHQIKAQIQFQRWKWVADRWKRWRQRCMHACKREMKIHTRRSSVLRSLVRSWEREIEMVKRVFTGSAVKGPA